jgi:EAL domain-containing protein (putative c-di-GMP-specific phosphodiesterase class I)
VAEETGWIHPIGRWVLQEACRQLTRWRAELPEAAGLTMSVNVFAHQLQDPNLVAEDVTSALELAGSIPARSSWTYRDRDGRDQAAAETLQALRWMSVQIAMDDFGTGYSSLSSLSQLPLDILKIDRSFVERLDRGHEGRAIVYAMMSLANASASESPARASRPPSSSPP